MKNTVSTHQWRQRCSLWLWLFFYSFCWFAVSRPSWFVVDKKESTINAGEWCSGGRMSNSRCGPISSPQPTQCNTHCTCPEVAFHKCLCRRMFTVVTNLQLTIKSLVCHPVMIPLLYSMEFKAVVHQLSAPWGIQSLAQYAVWEEAAEQPFNADHRDRPIQ